MKIIEVAKFQYAKFQYGTYKSGDLWIPKSYRSKSTKALYRTLDIKR